MSLDALKGKVANLKMAANSKEVKAWIDAIKELREIKIAQNYSAKGEDAGKAMSEIMGIDEACRIDVIYESMLRQQEQIESERIRNTIKLART